MKDQSNAAAIATKIIKKLSASYKLKEHKIEYITTSVGIEILTKENCERETIVKNADMAMYGAKKQGKNQYQFFTPEMTNDAVNRLKIENNLKGLVSNKKYDDECSLLYQPIIERNGNDYKIIGLEALIRWTNPELGVVFPVTFIPIAEETNLISPLGEWVLLKACSDVKTIVDKNNPSFYVSVNLSAKQLKSAELIPKIKEIIKQVKIKPKHLQLELTETSYLDDQAVVSKTLSQLQEMGIRIAIDDFGIGYASLTYLQKVPASTIKIDRSFTKNINENNMHKQFITSIINFGNNLNKDIIVEGVETPSHLHFLNDNKCTRYQGFFFSKPVSLDEITKLLSVKFEPAE
jgi:EAL domain-containing protein (putative c-di-GMP-specific phosphodiesterase class I)